MNFDLNEQQREFQQAAADFLVAECPVGRALAPHESGQADMGLWRGLMELGIGGLVVPEAYGGLGLGLLDLAVVAEVVGRYAAPGPFFEHAVATLAITLAADDDQKARWLPRLASGALCATFAFAEGKGVWMSGQWTVPAGTRLSGRKSHVLHAEHADLLVVGLEGGQLAVVERGAQGLSAQSVPCTDAGRRMANITLLDTPAVVLPQVEGARVADAALVLLAADAFGGASQCVRMSVDYAKLREQFGRPIGSFQALKHQLANMALDVEPNVGLYWYAAHAFDHDPEAAPEAAALAKSLICEKYPKVARAAIEAHGGIGYTWEFGAHVWLKRALFNQAYMGMPQAHRARLATLAGW